MESGKLSRTETNDILEAFINSTPFGIFVIDNSGKIEIVNQLAQKYLDINIPLNKIIESNILDIVAHITDLRNVLSSNLKKQEHPFSIEALLFSEKFFSVIGCMIPDGYIITIEDVTKKKEMELNSLQSILEGQENERRRLGREIHDGIGPLLSFMKLSLDSFIDDLHMQDPKTETEVLDSISETIDSLTADLRSLSHRLMPRLLDEFGLIPAFDNLVFRLNKSRKVNITFYSNMDKECRLDKNIELTVFRCNQELLNNAVKYADANTIMVQLILHKDSIVLMVEDDGNGFEKEKLSLKNFGIGLTNIDTRVRMLNGEFILETSIGKGTMASIEIPIM